MLESRRNGLPMGMKGFNMNTCVKRTLNYLSEESIKQIDRILLSDGVKSGDYNVMEGIMEEAPEHDVFMYLHLRIFNQIGPNCATNSLLIVSSLIPSSDLSFFTEDVCESLLYLLCEASGPCAQFLSNSIAELCKAGKFDSVKSDFYGFVIPFLLSSSDLAFLHSALVREAAKMMPKESTDVTEFVDLSLLLIKSQKTQYIKDGLDALVAILRDFPGEIDFDSIMPSLRLGIFSEDPELIENSLKMHIISNRPPEIGIGVILSFVESRNSQIAVGSIEILGKFSSFYAEFGANILETLERCTFDNPYLIEVAALTVISHFSSFCMEKVPLFVRKTIEYAEDDAVAIQLIDSAAQMICSTYPAGIPQRIIPQFETTARMLDSLTQSSNNEISRISLALLKQIDPNSPS